MSVAVKVVPEGQTLQDAVAITLQDHGRLNIRGGDSVVLELTREQIAAFTRQGGNLVLELANGQQLTLVEFFGDERKPPHLYLQEDDHLVAVELPATHDDGALLATFALQDGQMLAGFESLTAGAGLSGGATAGLILGGLALGGLGLSGGGGGQQETASPPPAADTVAPAPASSLAISDDGRQLTGKAEPGANVGVDTNNDGRPDQTGVVGADGNFLVLLDPPLTNGETVSVVVTDKAGNQSAENEVVAGDSTAPGAATDLQVAGDGSSISGKGEPGARVDVDTNGDGQPDASTIVGSDGQFQLPLTPPVTNGETISVVLTDAAGNSSEPGTVQAPDFPDAPQVNPSNGSSIEGTAAPGTNIVISDADGTPIGQTTTGADDGWSYVPAVPLPDSTVIVVVARDSAGNDSPETTITTDGIAPAMPVIEQGNGTVIAGTAEPGSTITLTDGIGNPIGQVMVDDAGEWTCTPAVQLADGTVVSATATDAASNSSLPATITVDAAAPPAPAIHASNGSVLSGTAEPDSTITLTDGSGNPIGGVVTDGLGNWTYSPAVPLQDGTVVRAVATDAVGNPSAAATTTVDASAPLAPLIAPSNGTVLTGTAEAGSTITLTDGVGTPIGVTTADGTGSWTYTPATLLPDGLVIKATATDAVGNQSIVATGTVDAVPPPAPIIDPSNGTVITGTAEASSTITLTDGVGTPIGTTTADGTGNWSYSPGTALPDGTVVKATATDAAGNTGTAATTTVDAVAPAAPIIDLSNGTVITGTAEADSTITLTDGVGNPIGVTTTDGTGNWTYTPAAPFFNGTVVNAIATDAAGNPSTAATTTVDAIAPSAPVIDPSNGTVLTGTAETGSIITLTDGVGTPIGTTTADGTGSWSYTPGTALLDGTVVKATATDASGNAGAAATTTVDAVAPAAPVINPSNGTVLTGTAEADSTITLTDSGGNPIGVTTADGTGNWSYTPGTALPDGTVVKATATDAAGNAGAAATTTVDAVAPPAPIIDPSNGTVLTGTAEAGSTITLTDSVGTPLGTTTADGMGNWSYTPSTALSDGTVVKATATDAVGNAGAAATTTVDAVAPAAPVINPSNGTVVSGTAEADSTITLTDSGGNPIGVTTADGTGNWSYTPGTALSDGTVVKATATDAAGNAGATTTAIVDAVPPAAPIIDPSNGTMITGAAEADSTVTLTDGVGTPIGTTTADGIGNWSYNLSTALLDGTVVKATATDAAGNTGIAATTTVDAVAPAAPVINPSNGAVLTGTAEADSIITLTDSGGNPIGWTTADGAGNWTYTPAAPLANGTVVNAKASDAIGNTSIAATITVDAVAPAAPIIDPSNGTEITGTAEAESTITLTDGVGTPIGTTIADGTGNWSYTPGTALSDATVVKATATDAAGNTGAVATTTVDAVAPAAPVINPSNGTVLTGTTEADSTITLTDGVGNPLGTTIADGTGNWSYTPGTALPDGTVVKATATDAAGNTGIAATTTVDAVAPVAPVINPSNGTVLTGTAEAGSTITLTDSAGTPIGTTTADGTGNWSYTPGTALPNGTVVKATATDDAGNTGAVATTTVDAVAPAAPVINPSNGTVVSGTAEADSTITLTDSGGNPIGVTTADGTGNWSYTPGTALPDGTVVKAIATDAAGNTGAAATTTVDAVAPAAPLIDPSNGTVISGTAEADSTITLTDSVGNPIGTTTADGTGNWSYTPGTALLDGTVVKATATDVAGNAGTAATTTVDAVAPPAPIIDPSNGTVITGTAEADSTITLTDSVGNPIGTTTADGTGNWSYTPGTALPDGTVVKATATDVAGNTGTAATTTVDAVAPAAPLIDPSNGTVIAGTAEAGSTITLTDGVGNPIGETTTDGTGNWTYSPGTALPDGTVVKATATDAAGNTGATATTTVDSVAPAAPLLTISADGALLTGSAEPDSQVQLVINGDSANPVVLDLDATGTFSLPLTPALIAGEAVVAVAVDAAGNTSVPGTASAPDLATPLFSVPEAADTWVNAAEIGDGIQVDVTLRPTMRAGQVVTVKFAGQSGYEAEASHTLTVADILAGNVIVAITPPGGNGPFPEGAATVTAEMVNGTVSTPVAFTIDTIAPPLPVLSLAGNLLSISSEPGTELTVTVTGVGTTATATLTADNSGLASLDLLTGLDIGLTWDQLLNAQVSVVGADVAGNPSNVASVGVGANIEQPVTIGNFALDTNALPPRLGLSGTTDPNSSVVIHVITPALNVQLVSIQADPAGDWALNLLDPAVLSQLGLTATEILALGADLSFTVVSTDTTGNDSAVYGIALHDDGVLLSIGRIDVNGTPGGDVMSGANGSSEYINAGAGDDLIFNAGTGDHVLAGDGNDTIQVTAANYASVDGGLGFDTLLLANGIDLDYNAAGVGTLSSIERIDLGRGDAGSTLTLTAAEVLAITDGSHVLQITGDLNDTINIVGAVDTGTTQLINGILYEVYTYGTSTVLVEENTALVVVA